MSATGSLTKPAERLVSIDTYRGFVMFLMLAEALRLCAVSDALPSSAFWKLLCHHQSHAEWIGCSLHDLIQPSFFFLVGVGLAFSVANRRAKGQKATTLTKHATIRAIILVLLGIGIESVHPREFTWSFSDTLTQIGLSYGFAFALCLRPVRDCWIAFAAILVGYWLLFALYPVPGPDFDYAKVGVSQGWLQQYGLSGFAAHWQKNSNPAWAFDTWFRNLVPLPGPFTHHYLGIATLNFVPSIGTMILGVVAGRVLRGEHAPWMKFRWLAIAGAAGLSTGWLLGALGVCPVVKRIWTPSWVLFSGGWCFLFIATFYALVEIGQCRRAAFPLVVIGMNSIVAYCGSHLYSALAFSAPRRIVGPAFFTFFGEAYEPVVYGLTILVGYWLALFLMYQKKLFVRI